MVSNKSEVRILTVEVNPYEEDKETHSLFHRAYKFILTLSSSFSATTSWLTAPSLSSTQFGFPSIYGQKGYSFFGGLI